MSFVNPWILAFCGLVGVPILFHLLRRRPVVPKKWGAFRLLRQMESRHRRARMEKALLLVLRVLFVLCLVFAFARPTGGLALLGAGSLGADNLVVILDTSFSMGSSVGSTGAGAGKATLFEGAVKRAKSHLESVGFEKATLLRMSTRPRAAFDGFTSQRSLLEAAVADSEVGAGATDAVAALRAAAYLLEEARDEPGETRGTILLYHDFQRNAWDLEKLAALNEQWRGLDLKVGLIDIRGQAPDASNQTLTGIEWNTDVPSPNTDLALTVTILNHQSKPSEERVSLELDGVSHYDQTVEVPAATDDGPGRLAVYLPVSLSEAGPHRGRVWIGPDALLIDNERFFALEAVDQIEVLVVDGDPQLDPSDSEAFLPSRLLSPQVSGNTHSVVVPAWELGGVRFEDYDTILLLNVSRLGSDVVDRLRSYVQGGGGLVYLPGAAVHPEDFRASLTGTGEGREEGSGRIRVVPEGFLPGYPRRRVRAEGEGIRLDPARSDFRHPLIRRFEGSDLAAARFRTIFELEEVDATAVPLYFDNGMPALLERNYGAGRILLFACSASPEWGEFMTTASTAPLLLQAVYHTSGTIRLDRINRLVEQDAAIPFEFGLYDRTVVVRRPDGSEGAVQTRASRSGESIATLHDLDRVGIYSYRIEDEGEERFLAVNVDPTESDPGGIDPQEIAALLDSVQVVVQVEDLLEEPRVPGGDGWLILVLAAVVVICAECHIANKDL